MEDNSNGSYFLAVAPAPGSGNSSSSVSSGAVYGEEAAEVAVSPPIDVDGFDYHMYIEDLNLVRSHWTDDGAYLPTTITYALTFIVGITGNSLVVFALLCDRKARNVTSSFLVSLAVADLVFLLICVPYNLAAMFTTIWKGGLILCKSTGFVEMLSASASVLNLTAVSVERYVVIVHPLKSRSWCTMGNTKKIIGSVWVIAVLLSAPMLYTMDTNVGLYYNNESYYVTSMCTTTNSLSRNDRIVFSWYQMLVMFLLPTAVMVFCYAFVIHVLWISTKELARMTQTTRMDSRRLSSRSSAGGQSSKPRLSHSTSVKDHSAEFREARKQVIRMLLTIIATFFLSWGPRLVYNVIKQHSTTVVHTDSVYYASVVINLLPYVQSCSNPLIYGFMSKNFRRSMRLSCNLAGERELIQQGRVCCCDGYRLRRERHVHEYELDLKSTNGNIFNAQSRGYSPPMTSRGGGRTYSSMISDG